MRIKRLAFVASFVAVTFVCTTSIVSAQDKTPEKSAATTEKAKDVDNSEKAKVKNVEAYIKGNMLHVRTPSVNDFIFVYNASGLCIDKFVKKEELIVKDVSAYPDGRLVITNGKDLTVEIVK